VPRLRPPETGEGRADTTGNEEWSGRGEQGAGPCQTFPEAQSLCVRDTHTRRAHENHQHKIALVCFSVRLLQFVSFPEIQYSNLVAVYHVYGWYHDSWSYSTRLLNTCTSCTRRRHVLQSRMPVKLPVLQPIPLRVKPATHLLLLLRLS